jgi:hypothetical protein
LFPLELSAHQDSAPVKHWQAWKEEEEQDLEDEAQSSAVFHRTSIYEPRKARYYLIIDTLPKLLTRISLGLFF